MNEMETVSQVIDHLKKKGYVEDLNLQQNCLVCTANNFRMLHDEFVIDQVYRFEGQSDPGDEATVYAISSPKYGIKGILVNGAGIYTDELTDEMVAKLHMKQ